MALNKLRVRDEDVFKISPVESGRIIMRMCSKFGSGQDFFMPRGSSPPVGS